MVGRLVEQQNVGVGRQHARQRGAARFAAGEMGGILLAGQPELFDQVARLVRIVARREPVFDIGQGGGVAGKFRFLRQIADGGAGLDEDAAAVRLDHAGGDLQQRRLAGAVAADQADALALRDRQVGRGQERRAAKGERDLAQLDQGGHGFFAL